MAWGRINLGSLPTVSNLPDIAHTQANCVFQEAVSEPVLDFTQDLKRNWWAMSSIFLFPVLCSENQIMLHYSYQLARFTPDTKRRNASPTRIFNLSNTTQLQERITPVLRSLPVLLRLRGLVLALDAIGHIGILLFGKIFLGFERSYTAGTWVYPRQLSTPQEKKKGGKHKPALVIACR